MLPVTRLLEERVKTLTYKYIDRRSYTEKQSEIIYSKDLSIAFMTTSVSVSIDKANSNIAITCEPLYASINKGVGYRK